MAEEKRFPVLWPYGRQDIQQLKELGCPSSVPWGLVAPHEAQAKRNHDQTLEQLAVRGGLCPRELYAVLAHWSWWEVTKLDMEFVVGALHGAIARYDAKHEAVEAAAAAMKETKYEQVWRHEGLLRCALEYSSQATAEVTTWHEDEGTSEMDGMVSMSLQFRDMPRMVEKLKDTKVRITIERVVEEKE